MQRASAEQTYMQRTEFSPSAPPQPSERDLGYSSIPLTTSAVPIVQASSVPAPTYSGTIGHTAHSDESIPVVRAVPVASAAVPLVARSQEKTTAARPRTVDLGLQVFDDPAYVTTSPTTLILKEKLWSFSGDSFSIKDQFGTTWFECKGRALSIREKKVVSDARQKAVFVMKEQLFSWAPTQYIYHPRNNVQGNHMFKIRGKLTFAKAKLYATVRDKNTGNDVMLVLKGDFFDFNATVYIGEPKQGGRPIAKIHRAFTGRDLFFGVQQYHVDIVPGVDAAMIVAMCISFDELKNDRNN